MYYDSDNNIPTRPPLQEALELLRTAGTEVRLEVVRPPAGAMQGVDAGLGHVVTTSLTLPRQHHLSPSPSFSSYRVSG